MKELFDLYEIMKELNLPSKCGVDTRDYVQDLYGAYFYTRTVEEGQEVYEIVKTAIEGKISAEMPLILKRACTEFELVHGDSSKYEQTETDKEWERIVHKIVDVTNWEGLQPWYVINHVKRMWLAWAYKHKDMTCLEFNDGQDLAAKPTTYHKPIEGNANG